jgi:hypothetical protein
VSGSFDGERRQVQYWVVVSEDSGNDVTKRRLSVLTRNRWGKRPVRSPFSPLSVTPFRNPFPATSAVTDRPSIGKKTRNRKGVQKETVNRPSCA